MNKDNQNLEDFKASHPDFFRMLEQQDSPLEGRSGNTYRQGTKAGADNPGTSGLLQDISKKNSMLIILCTLLVFTNILNIVTRLILY